MAVEHTMFKFGDLKVTSHDDRMTDRMKSTKCGPSRSCTLMIFLMHFKKLSDTHEIIHKVCRNN